MPEAKRKPSKKIRDLIDLTKARPGLFDDGSPRPRSVMIVLPLPPLACSPNWQRQSHRAHAAARKAFRRDATYAAMAARNAAAVGEPFDRAEVSAVFFTGGDTATDGLYRPRDRDNAVASLKGAIDGLRDARLIGSDAHKRLRWGEVTIVSNKRDHGGLAQLVITVHEVTA